MGEFALSIIPHIIGAVLMALAFVLHVITIGTPSWTYSAHFRPLQYKAMRSSNMTLMHGQYDRMIQYGLFRLCSDACIYELDPPYYCFMGANDKNKTDTKTMCFTLVPKPSMEMYGENGIQSPDWLMGAQAMAILGLIALPVGGVLTIVMLKMICKYRGGKSGAGKTFAVILGLSFIISGIISIVADIIYGVFHARLALWDGHKDFYEDLSGQLQDWYDELLELHWGFWLDVAAGILGIVAGIMHLIGVCTYSDKEDSRRLANSWS